MSTQKNIVHYQNICHFSVYFLAKRFINKIELQF